MAMKVLLVQPPAVEAYGRYRAAAKVAAQPQMPLGLGYIGAVLERAGHNIIIIDSDVEEMGLGDIVEKLDKFRPDVVGVTATTPIYPNAKRLLAMIKEKREGIVTVLGGFHLTALPLETMADCTADYGVYGEGEETAIELMETLERGKGVSEVKGILYRERDSVIANPPRPPIWDLDELPYPARHLLKYRSYLWSVPTKGWRPVTSIVTQRGCVYQCVFCGVRTMFRGTRYRKATHIVDELEYIVNELGIDHIQFQDDTLTLNARKVMEMCDEIRGRGLRITWEGYTRADTISKELLKAMKDAGLVRLSFGVESGNQGILDALKKGIKIEQLERAYEWCHELGLETRCSVMIGNPFETKATVRQTVKFINSLRCYQAYINITMPYPGTELLHMAREGYGGLKLLSEDWGEYRRYGNAVMEMNDLTREDLVKLQRWAYLRFYLRPHIIWYNLKRAGLKAALINVRAFADSIFRL